MKSSTAATSVPGITCRGETPSASASSSAGTTSTTTTSGPCWLHTHDTSAFRSTAAGKLLLPPSSPCPTKMTTSSSSLTAPIDGSESYPQHHVNYYHGYTNMGYPQLASSSIDNVHGNVHLYQHQHEPYLQHLMQLHELQLLQQLQFQNSQQQHQVQQQIQQSHRRDRQQKTDEVHLPLKKRRIVTKSAAAAIAAAPSNAVTESAATISSATERIDEFTTSSSLPLLSSSSSSSSSSTNEELLLLSSSSSTTDDERIAALTLLTAFGRTVSTTARGSPSCVSSPVLMHGSMSAIPTTMIPEAFSEAAAASDDTFDTSNPQAISQLGGGGGTSTPSESMTSSSSLSFDVSGNNHIPSLVTPDAVPKQDVRRAIDVHPLLEETKYTANKFPCELFSSDGIPGSGDDGTNASLELPSPSSPETAGRKKLPSKHGAVDKHRFKALPDSTLGIRPSLLIGNHQTFAHDESKGLPFSVSSTTSLPIKYRIKNNKPNKTLTKAMFNQSGQDEDSSTTTRIFHPKLKQPLPGGCHGRTSRNGGFCRRGPCFADSKYCKLHHEHWLRTGSPTIVLKTVKASPKSSSSPPIPAQGDDGIVDGKSICHDGFDESALTCTVIMEDNGNSSKDKFRGPAALAPPAPESSSSITKMSKRPQQPQDRQYTGKVPGEVQCKATTTRGRPCKYVAVVGVDNDSDGRAHSKYCRLHADHDTNPSPPRRAQQLANSDEEPRQNKSVVCIGSAGQPSLKVEHCKNETTKQKKKKTKASCSRTDPQSDGSKLVPVGLNCLPSSQWDGQKVTIAAGPYMNQTGRVVKWNNGWVTVCMDPLSGSETSATSNEVTDVVHHNRRSFELILCPDDRQQVV